MFLKCCCRLPSFSTVGVVVGLVVGVVGLVRTRRAAVDWPFSLEVMNVVAASKHVGCCGFAAMARLLLGAGGDGVPAVGA